MKTKPPKMTDADKVAQHRGSRFIRVIPAHRYAEYLHSRASEHKYDSRGYRIR